MQMSSRLRFISKETTSPLAKEQRHMAESVQFCECCLQAVQPPILFQMCSGATTHPSLPSCSCSGLWDATGSLAAREAVTSLLMSWVLDNSDLLSASHWCTLMFEHYLVYLWIWHRFIGLSFGICNSCTTESQGSNYKMLLILSGYIYIV